MTRGWMSVAFACAFGAFIGALSALEISARFAYGSYLWGIGALLGGAVAYVAVDFRHFCAGVAHSYRRTIAWRPFVSFWTAVGMEFISFMSLVTTCLSAFAIFVLLAADSTVARDISAIFTLMFIAIMCIMGSLSLSINARKGRTDCEWERSLLRSRQLSWNFFLKTNPLSVSVMIVAGTFYLLRVLVGGTLSGIVSLPRFVAEGGRKLANFVVGVFVYIHSERRTICFVDATIGAAIGYSYGSVFIGAVAGVVIGLVNYEVVSVRWLKLAPAPTN